VDCDDNSRGVLWAVGRLAARGEREDFGEAARVKCAEDRIGGLVRGRVGEPADTISVIAMTGMSKLSGATSCEWILHIGEASKRSTPSEANTLVWTSIGSRRKPENLMHIPDESDEH
jgi:hypothetical protein